jgi:hypothetical protein
MHTMVADIALTERGSNGKICDVLFRFPYFQKGKNSALSLMLMNFHLMDLVDPLSSNRLVVMKTHSYCLIY